MSSVRMLGICGLASAVLAMLAGFMEQPFLLGVSGAIMTGGNLYAIWKGNN